MYRLETAALITDSLANRFRFISNLQCLSHRSLQTAATSDICNVFCNPSLSMFVSCFMQVLKKFRFAGFLDVYASQGSCGSLVHKTKGFVRCWLVGGDWKLHSRIHWGVARVKSVGSNNTHQSLERSRRIPYRRDVV
jgi:hypothetical protein